MTESYHIIKTRYPNIKVIIRPLLTALLFLAVLLVFLFALYPLVIEAEAEKDVNWVRIVVGLILGLIVVSQAIVGVFRISKYNFKKKVLKEGNLVLAKADLRVCEYQIQNRYGQVQYREHYLRFKYFSKSISGDGVVCNEVHQDVRKKTNKLLNDDWSLPAAYIPLRLYGSAGAFDEEAFLQISEGKLDPNSLPVYDPLK